MVGNAAPGNPAGKCHRKDPAQAAVGLADARARHASAAGKGEKVR